MITLILLFSLNLNAMDIVGDAKPNLFISGSCIIDEEFTPIMHEDESINWRLIIVNFRTS